MHGILPKVNEITIYYKQQLRSSNILSRDLFMNAPLYGAGVPGSPVMYQHP